VDRLSTADRTSRFTHEYAPPRCAMSDFENGYDSCDGMKSNTKAEKKYSGARRPDGISTEQLKSECRNKGLVVGGKRFDLVLRLLQHETAAQTGIEPKKAQGTFDDTTGEFKPKPRAKCMKLPDPVKLGERMKKKAYPTEKEQSKWGNNKFKYHASSCIMLCNELLQKEVVEKDLFSRGEEELVWQVVLELILYWMCTVMASLDILVMVKLSPDWVERRMNWDVFTRRSSSFSRKPKTWASSSTWKLIVCCVIFAKKHITIPAT
jgi:hypothetical protein